MSITQAYAVFLLVMTGNYFLYPSFLFGITINNKPLHEWIEQGKVLTLTPTNTHSKLAKLYFNGNNISLTLDNIHRMKNLQEKFDLLIKECPEQGQTSSSDTYRVKSDNSIFEEHFYRIAKDSITLEGPEISLIYSLTESPTIILKADEMNFDHSYIINAKKLCLETSSPESYCASIIITFCEKVTKPIVIHGHINFGKNKTDQQILMTNIKKIQFSFNQKAWEKKD